MANFLTFLSDLFLALLVSAPLAVGAFIGLCLVGEALCAVRELVGWVWRRVRP